MRQTVLFLSSSLLGPGRVWLDRHYGCCRSKLVRLGKASGSRGRDCLFMDMGSTTTDLIPIKENLWRQRPIFAPCQRELVYMGLLRTRLDSILPVARIRGDRVPLAPELFAIIADARLALGQIDMDQYTCNTADGMDKSRTSSLRRRARSVCADLEEIGDEGALAIARQACMEEERALTAAMERQAKKHSLNRVAAAGIGEWLIAKAASTQGMECVLLSELYGPRISNVFPAYAVARLLETDQIRLH